MKTSRRPGGCAAALVLALLLAGCGSSQKSGSPVDALGSAVSEFSSPAPEGSGLESPQSRQDDGPSITVASLPVGGAGTPDPADPDQQCASVNWRLGSLPAGVVVELGTISLNPSGIFELGGSGCGDQPHCVPGLRWTGDNSGCLVPVTQLRADTDATVTIEMAGRIRCPSRQLCDQLAKLLSGQPGSRVEVTAIPHQAGSSAESSAGESSGGG